MLVTTLSVQLPVRKAAAEGEEKQNLGIQATIWPFFRAAHTKEVWSPWVPGARLTVVMETWGSQDGGSGDVATALSRGLPCCRALVSLQFLCTSDKKLLRFKRRFLSRVSFLPASSWPSHTSLLQMEHYRRKRMLLLIQGRLWVLRRECGRTK